MAGRLRSGSLASWTAKNNLEFQSAFAGGVGEFFDDAVIQHAVAVEDDGVNTVGFGALGDDFTDHDGGGGATFAAVDLAGDVGLHRRSRGQRLASHVVDDLGVNVGQSAIDAQARARGGALDFGAQAQMTALA